ncbi:hypothetical protein PoB_003470900 [Plakobranchus ocellatus]|uniref:Transposable element P transposase-like RNase H domain-containing protein n=1 Tax=Plakobranchus ocellatus TaxID=259542 RepID=A0AAV4APU0_9GAST|nr:hypothetical protein PoB_003470900 [Plakobranchus ocellatus]
MSIKEAVCYYPKHDVVWGFEDYAHLGRSRYIANHACFFMARGLTANWKRPFGFVFSRVIRGKGGHRDNPDIRQFTSALQQVMFDSLMGASTRKSCKDDLDIFVFGLQNIASPSTLELATTQTNVYAAFNLQENVLPSLLNVQQANVLAYIAGCICHRIAPKMCRTCSQTLTTADSHPEHLFIYEKNYSSATSLLLTPSKYVMELCLQLENAYKTVCEEVLHKKAVKKTLTSYLINAVTEAVPECEQCNPVYLFSRLFTSVRLHHSLRLSNQTFCKTKMKRNREVLKLSHV